MPQEKNEILNIMHKEETWHGGRYAIYYAAIQKYYLPRLKEDAQNIVNQCLACSKNKQKTGGGKKFIESN